MFKRKIFAVTGSAGFVGSCLSRKLSEKGYDTHLILKEGTDTWRINDIQGRAQIHFADLEKKQDVVQVINEIRPDIVFHLAAYGGYHFQTDPMKSISANIIGTLNLLDACSKNGFDSFINTGSSSEYGLKYAPMKENDAIAPTSYYAVTKSCATLLCQMEAASRKMPINTVRLFSVYGPFEAKTRLVPAAIKACVAKQDLHLLSPTSVRDFIFVEDVIDIFFKLAAKQEISGHIFNAGSGKQNTTYEMVEEIIRLTGSSIKPLWRTAESRPTIEPTTWVADITKAKKMLGWEPTHSLTQGLLKTIEWFEKNLRYYE